MVALQPAVNLKVDKVKRWCTLCRKSTHGSTLKRHMAEHHKVGKMPDFPCTECKISFTRNQALIAHKAKTCKM